MDPNTCKDCHPKHFDEWSGSMHAYASDDPVFIAMNRRGQRETNGNLGDFCLRCHAPLAVADQEVDASAIDPAALPFPRRGVTCFFCHTVNDVDIEHPFNNSLRLAGDLVMRGGISDPVDNPVHASAYSPMHDGSNIHPSSRFCGSCHDIVTPSGGHIERTYDEWARSQYAKSPPDGQPLSCGSCHMHGETGVVAEGPRSAGLPLRVRRRYDHAFPAVDVALTDGFPQAEKQRQAVEENLQNRLLQGAICVSQNIAGRWSTIDVYLDNIGAGHQWPSGSTQDRRAWVEVIAYRGSQVVYHSGTDENGVPLTSRARVVDVHRVDPDLWLLRDCMFDARGNEVHMFWEAAVSDGNQLPVAASGNPSNPGVNAAHIVRRYPLFDSTPSTISGVPDRVTLRVLLQPVGQDVLELLAKPSPDGDPDAVPDLDPAVLDRMPVFSVLRPTKGNTKLDSLEWTPTEAIPRPSNDALVTRSCVMAGSVNFDSDWYSPPEHQNESCR